MTLAQIQARAKKIDGKSLVLEIPETGELIHWPLDKITAEFDVNNDISLKMESVDNHDIPDRNHSTPKKASQEKTTPDEATKRKFLEELIN